MIAFLVFFTLMIAFIVGSVCISMYLYARNWTAYLQGHQFVTLSQEAFIEGRACKQQRSQFDVEMGECVRSIVGISLGIVTVLVLLIVIFFNIVL
jgi:hypothetical protein